MPTSPPSVIAMEAVGSRLQNDEVVDEASAPGEAGAARRILLVQPTANLSGSTVSGQLVAQGFRRAGWSVDAILGDSGPGAGPYEQCGCRIRQIPHKNWLRGGNIFQAARRIGAEVGNARDFVAVMRELRPDLVYLNSLVCLAPAVAARRLRIPCVWHIRELFDDVGGEMRIPACGGKALVRWTLQHLSDRLVAISNAVRENVVGPRSKVPVEVVPNAVDDGFFNQTGEAREFRKEFGLAPDLPVIGVPGTLRPMKGHEFFLQAAARLAVSEPDCQFAITGDGEPQYAARLRQLATELGLGARVSFTGTVQRMERFYRACDMVCIPSRAEPFGRTVIEAFAVGTPVVATAVGGIRETVETGRTGILVAYDDVDALVAGLKALLNDSAMRRRLSLAAAQVAREKHSAAAYGARINAIVEDVLVRQTQDSR